MEKSIIYLWCWDHTRTDGENNDSGHIGIETNGLIYGLYPIKDDVTDKNPQQRGWIKEVTHSKLAWDYINIYIAKSDPASVSIFALKGVIEFDESSNIVTGKIKLPLAHVYPVEAAADDISAITNYLKKLASFGKNAPEEEVPDYHLLKFNCVSFVNKLLTDFGIFSEPLPLAHQYPVLFRRELLKRTEKANPNDKGFVYGGVKKVIGLEGNRYTWVGVD